MFSIVQVICPQLMPPNLFHFAVMALLEWVRTYVDRSNDLSGTVMTGCRSLAKNHRHTHYGTRTAPFPRGNERNNPSSGYASHNAPVGCSQFAAISNKFDSFMFKCANKHKKTQNNVSRYQQQYPQQWDAGPPRRQQSQQKP